jgi:hypothetical protein
VTTLDVAIKFVQRQLEVHLGYGRIYNELEFFVTAIRMHCGLPSTAFVTRWLVRGSGIVCMNVGDTEAIIIWDHHDSEMIGYLLGCLERNAVLWFIPSNFLW